MKTLFLTFTALFFTINFSFSQRKSEGFPMNGKEFKDHAAKSFPDNFKKHTLKLTPLKIIGAVLPSIELGYERQLNTNASAQITLGYLMENIHFKNNQKGFSFALEAKKYNKTNSGVYISLEAGYYHRHSDEGALFESNTLLDTNNSPLRYSETFSNVYNQVNLIPKLGIRSSLGKNLIIDAYFGIGVKWINIKHNNRSFPDDKMPYQVIDYLFIPNEVGYYSTIAQGNVITVKIPFNVRIGYTF